MSINKGSNQPHLEKFYGKPSQDMAQEILCMGEIDGRWTARHWHYLVTPQTINYIVGLGMLRSKYKHVDTYQCKTCTQPLCNYCWGWLLHMGMENGSALIHCL